MFKSLRLGNKIILGFSILLVILLVLGLISLFNMSKVAEDVKEMDGESIPITNLASLTNEKSLFYMYEMRGYGYTEDETFYNSGMNKYLPELREEMSKIIKVIDQSSNYKFLKDDLDKVDKLVNEYEVIAVRTKTKISELNKVREDMDENARKFETALKKYVDSTYDILQANINKIDNSASGRLERHKNMSNILDDINRVRRVTWRAQAQRDPKMLTEVMQILDTSYSKVKIVRETAIIKVNQDYLDNILSALAIYKKSTEDLLKTWEELQVVNKDRSDKGREVIVAVNGVASKTMVEVEKNSTGMLEILSMSSKSIVISVIIAILIGIVAAYIIIKSITRPIDKIVGELSESAGQVSAASMQLSDASHELAESSTEQAASIEETASTLSESSSMVQQNTENTKQTSILVQETKYAAETGNNEMKNMMEAMNGIKKSSDAIGKIIKVIDDIAFQTNILALNAAVEAARAGDAGMGFAVVAEEVRNLAQRSAQAASDTATMIAENINISEKGVILAEKVAEALKVINTKADKVDDIMQEVLAASIEQTQGISQINRAISQMEQVTHNIASNAEESSSASSELNAQAENMNFVVENLNIMIHGERDKNAVKRRDNNTKTYKTNYSKQSSSIKAVKSVKEVTPINRKTNTVNPDDIIPLEDDMDF